MSNTCVCVYVCISTEHDSCLLTVFVSLSVLESFLNSENAAVVRDMSGCLWRGSGQIRAPEPTETQRDTDKSLEPKEEMNCRTFVVHSNIMPPRGQTSWCENNDALPSGVWWSHLKSPPNGTLPQNLDVCEVNLQKVKLLSCISFLCVFVVLVAAHLAVRCRNTVSGSQPWTAALHRGSPHDEWTGLPHRNISKPCTRVNECETFTSLLRNSKH